MCKYDISLCVSSNKPQVWENIYNNIFNKKYSFEIIFVGPYSSVWSMPYNVVFIQSQVKPSQCVEIAVRNSNGKYIAVLSDDMVVCKYYYDNMLKFYIDKIKESGTRNVVVGGLDYFENRTKRRNIKLWPKNLSCGSEVFFNDIFISKKLWDELKGIDRNFIGIYWNYDISMRVLEIGGKCFRNNECVFREFPVKYEEDKQSDLTVICGKKDKGFFRFLWWKKWSDKKVEKERNLYFAKNDRGYIPMKRCQNVIPFSDDKILNFSQGEKGIWD